MCVPAPQSRKWPPASHLLWCRVRISCLPTAISALHGDTLRDILTPSMKHRLFGILSIASLVLCVAMAVVWIRSCWVANFWGCYRVGGNCMVTLLSYTGHLGLCNGYSVGESLTPIQGWFEEHAETREPHDEDWAYLGFYAVIGPRWGVVVPNWFICLAATIPPYLWFRSYRRHRRAALKELCPNCSYDLRASKKRCPEYGAPIAASAASSMPSSTPQGQGGVGSAAGG